MSIDIKSLFKNEFGEIEGLFDVIKVALSDSEIAKLSEKNLPGVYVFIRDGAAIRVGRSLKNAKKRSLQHIADNTGGEIRNMKNSKGCSLMLLTLKDSSKDALHWVCALEVFLERKLLPRVRSGRIG